MIGLGLSLTSSGAPLITSGVTATIDGDLLTITGFLGPPPVSAAISADTLIVTGLPIPGPSAVVSGDTLAITNLPIRISTAVAGDTLTIRRLT